MNVNSHFIKLETKRDLLAKQSKISELKNTYKGKTPSPLDLNKKLFWNRKLFEESQVLYKSPIYRHKLQIVSNFLLSKSGKLLDIGVGYGKLEDAILSNKSISIYGVDISSKAIEILSKQKKGIYKVGNILSIPYPDNKFDYVVALDILEHLPANKTFKAFGEISRVLKRNSVLVISVPLNEHLDRYLTKGENPNGHMRIYTQDLIKSELQIAGFEILNIQVLYAFRTWYKLKNFMIKLLKTPKTEPNLCIIFSRKK